MYYNGSPGKTQPPFFLPADFLPASPPDRQNTPRSQWDRRAPLILFLERKSIKKNFQSADGPARETGRFLPGDERVLF